MNFSLNKTIKYTYVILNIRLKGGNIFPYGKTVTNMKKKYFAFLGSLTGFANGLFGSGGGIIAVPMLEKAEIEQKKAHATSLAVTLPLSVVSVIFYISKETFDVSEAIALIPFGLIGAAVGALFLKKIPAKQLKIIFGFFLIIAGGRMILK